MTWSLIFFFNSILLGIGLAMDAFSVSLANGLHDTQMRNSKMCQIAGVFAFFQALMPMIGWICVHTIVHYLHAFNKFVPWIALVLLSYIGCKMLYEGLHGTDENDDTSELAASTLFMQGIATSIDALSVGFTIADYGLPMALVCSGIIALVTFIICICGIGIGKKVGIGMSDKASILGGVILIVIGLEIFITGIF